MTVYLRGSTYHLRKRVPTRFAAIDSRSIISVSLNTDSPREAQRKADAVWQGMLAGWQDILDGKEQTGRARLETAERLAARYHFSYMPAPAVAALPIEDLVARTLAVPKTADGSANQVVGDALLGGVEEVGLTIREALDEFWKISVDQTRGKTEDQIRRWKNPRIKAVENFVSVVGNKELCKITREDAKRFRDWWNARIDKEGLTANSANKDFTHVAHTLNVVDDALGGVFI